MNFINPKSTEIKAASQFHFESLLSPVLERIESLSFPSNLIFELFINDKLELILKGSPNDLVKIHNSIVNYLENPIFKKDLEHVFNYATWFSVKRKTTYRAYELAKNLNINTCTYCNRLYTKTVTKSNRKLTRPQFDHWFPKEDFPVMALSFFNLIPSCNICNTSIKGRARMSLSTHMHPYINTGENLRFSFNLISYNKFEFKVEDNGIKRVRNTIDFFKIQEIYEAHMDEIHDLVTLKQKYSTNYLNNLRKIISGVSIPDDEIYRLAFSTYRLEENFEKRPLSRMKRDLLTELRII